MPKQLSICFSLQPIWCRLRSRPRISERRLVLGCSLRLLIIAEHIASESRLFRALPVDECQSVSLESSRFRPNPFFELVPRARNRIFQNFPSVLSRRDHLIASVSQGFNLVQGTRASPLTFFVSLFIHVSNDSFAIISERRRHEAIPLSSHLRVLND